jgi:hypothetical protein
VHRDRIPVRLAPQQQEHFADDFVYIDQLTFCRRLLVQRWSMRARIENFISLVSLPVQSTNTWRVWQRASLPGGRLPRNVLCSQANRYAPDMAGHAKNPVVEIDDCCWKSPIGLVSNESASSVERDPSDYDIRQTLSGAIPYRLVAKRGPAMSVYSQKQVMRFCARRRSRSCMITLLVCGSMLTSVALGRGYSPEVDSLS